MQEEILSNQENMSERPKPLAFKDISLGSFWGNLYDMS